MEKAPWIFYINNFWDNELHQRYKHWISLLWFANGTWKQDHNWQYRFELIKASLLENSQFEYDLLWDNWSSKGIHLSIIVLENWVLRQAEASHFYRAMKHRLLKLFCLLPFHPLEGTFHTFLHRILFLVFETDTFFLTLFLEDFRELPFLCQSYLLLFFN